MRPMTLILVKGVINLTPMGVKKYIIKVNRNRQ